MLSGTQRRHFTLHQDKQCLNPRTLLSHTQILHHLSPATPLQLARWQRTPELSLARLISMDHDARSLWEQSIEWEHQDPFR
ncbi:hypothetical protein BDR05DRAFT_96054 [Suillus weaverae]|nr:hypothetical protein BDR05DRAFT_96054 [Suillus weaverae]